MASLGLDVVFAGRAGAADAEFHRQELARFGVEPHLAVDESAATGSIVVLVGPDGERTMITDRGANLRLRPADVPTALFDGVALLHLTGYSFFAPAPREVALALIREASRLGVPFTIDPGSAAFLSQLAPGAFLTWTEGAAVCFPNLDEAAVLAGAVDGVGDGAADPEAMAILLSGHYGAAVVKLGAGGALVATEGTQPARVAARPAVVRDTTGAGDAFCAGFLAAWLPGGPPAAAAVAGVTAAARAVSALGGRPQLTQGPLPYGDLSVREDQERLTHGRSGVEGRAGHSGAACRDRRHQLRAGLRSAGRGSDPRRGNRDRGPDVNVFLRLIWSPHDRARPRKRRRPRCPAAAGGAAGRLRAPRASADRCRQPRGDLPEP
jgi:sugar/nucleoside kinase (ribokinase family)